MLSDDHDEASIIPAQPLSPFAVAAAEGFRCGDAAAAGCDSDDDDSGDDGALRPPGNARRRGRRPASRLGSSSRKALLDDSEDDEEEDEKERRRARAAAFALTPSKVSGLRGLVAICGGAAAAGVAADGTPVVSVAASSRSRAKRADPPPRASSLLPPPHPNSSKIGGPSSSTTNNNTNSGGNPPSSSSAAASASSAAALRNTCSLDRARSALAANGALLEIVGTAHVRGAVRTLAKSVVRGLRAWQNPTVAPAGLGGTYFFLNESGQPAAIIKPCDEEALAPNNPKGFVGRKLGEPGLKPTVRVGEAALREVAAYLLDHGGAARVPPTVLVRVAHPVFHVAPPPPTAAPGSGGGGCDGPPSSTSSRYAPSLPPVPDTSRPVSPDSVALVANAGSVSSLADGEKTPCRRPRPFSSSSRPASSTLSAAIRRSGGGVVEQQLPRCSSSSPKTGTTVTAAALPLSSTPRPPPKLASMQAFVHHDGDASEVGSSRFSVRDVHRIGILDVRLFNTDRHAGNVLFVKEEEEEEKGSTLSLGGSGGGGDADENSARSAALRAAAALRGLDPPPLTLYPIDHGFALPEALEPPYFEWMFWPQAAQPFSKEELSFIDALDVEADVALLRAQLPSLHLGCLRVLTVGSTVLKRCAAAGLTLAEVGAALSRPLVGMDEEPSELERLCWEARGVALKAQREEEEGRGADAVADATVDDVEDGSSLSSDGGGDEKGGDEAEVGKEEEEEDSAHEEALGGKGRGGETPAKRGRAAAAAAASLAPSMSRSATCPLPSLANAAAANANSSSSAATAPGSGGALCLQRACTADDAAAFALSVAGAVAGGWAAAELAQPRTDAEELLLLDQQQQQNGGGGGQRDAAAAQAAAAAAANDPSSSLLLLSPRPSPETPLAAMTSYPSSSCDSSSAEVQQFRGKDGGTLSEEHEQKQRRRRGRAPPPPPSSSLPARSTALAPHRRASHGGALGGKSDGRGLAGGAALPFVAGGVSAPGVAAAAAALRKATAALLPPRLSLDSRAIVSEVKALEGEKSAASTTTAATSIRLSPSRSAPVPTPERRRRRHHREELQQQRDNDSDSSASESLSPSHPLSRLYQGKASEKTISVAATTAKANKDPSVAAPPLISGKTNPAAAYPPPVVPGSAPGAALPLADLSESGWRAFVGELERLLSEVIASGKWKAQQQHHHRELRDGCGGGGGRSGGGGGICSGVGALDDLLGASCPRF